MSYALLGTVEAARQGASLSTADVTVIDSSFTDQAMKFQVVEAAKLAQEGKDLETILAHVEDVKNHTELYIGVSTLENLVKGGRIGRVTGLLSSLLNIRVVMQMKNHELQPIVKGRGAKTWPTISRRTDTSPRPSRLSARTVLIRRENSTYSP